MTAVDPLTLVRCDECRFVEVAAGGDGPRHECHRYPPTIFVLDNLPLRVWPTVSADDWCGEYAYSTRGWTPQ